MLAWGWYLLGVVYLLVYVTRSGVSRTSLGKRILHVILESRAGAEDIGHGAIVVDLTHIIFLQFQFHRVETIGTHGCTLEKYIVSIVLCRAMANFRHRFHCKNLVKVVG
jgi:hypothetical protein